MNELRRNNVRPFFVRARIRFVARVEEGSRKEKGDTFVII